MADASMLISLMVGAAMLVSDILYALWYFFWKQPSNQPAGDVEMPQQQQQQQQPHPVDPDVRARIHAFLFESAQASSSSTAAAATTHYEEAKCILCQYEFENGDSMKSVPLCAHAFHSECIEEYMMLFDTCPLCREVIGFPPQVEDQ